MTETILKLNATGGQTRQVEARLVRFDLIPQRRFHQTVHPTPSLVLAVGEHHKAPSQVRRGIHVARIHAAGEGILHQLHADAVEVLDDQKVIDRREFLKKLIRCKARHDGRGDEQTWRSWPHCSAGRCIPPGQNSGGRSATCRISIRSAPIASRCWSAIWSSGGTNQVNPGAFFPTFAPIGLSP